MLTIQVYDAGAVEAIEKAIQQSELGLNPSRDGSLIRVIIPALNEERRKDLIKKVGKMSEEARVALRNLRRDEVENVKKQVKNKEISEDDSRRAQDEIQKILDKVIADVDAAAAAKEKELMEV
jgi:ribosome recycling factor